MSETIFLFVFVRGPVVKLAGAPAIMTEVLRGFYKHFEANFYG